MTDLRLAELLASLAHAADASAGQPLGCSLGATIMAVRIARAVGVAPEAQPAVFYTGLLRFTGCSSTAPETAAFALGDDLTANYALTMADPADPVSVRASLEARFAPDADPAERAAVIDAAIEALPHLVAGGVLHCDQARALAKRLPLPPLVDRLLRTLESRWDERHPVHPSGVEVPLESRIVEFVAVAELYRRAGGMAALHELARARAGGQFDPEICQAAIDLGPALIDGLDPPHGLLEVLLDEEPGVANVVTAEGRAKVAEVIADFTDNKSAWLVGHSRRVAKLARLAGLELGVGDAQTLYIAGLVHDVGRCAVPNGVWDQPGELSRTQRRAAESHSRHTEDMLAVSPAFDDVRLLASSAHERGDGSGYHRRQRGHEVAPALVAAADVYCGLTDRRPWRDALTDKDAAGHLLGLADQGALSREAVRGVLRAAGHGKRLADRAYPDGLTARQVEVLRELARGRTTKEVAATLDMATKTADNHIQAIYEKIDAQTRTHAALYALEHGLFDD